ncbi:hypothetical protein SLE2022_279960 [Rubroshorea leprosula]
MRSTVHALGLGEWAFGNPCVDKGTRKTRDKSTCEAQMVGKLTASEIHSTAEDKVEMWSTFEMLISNIKIGDW